MSKNLRKSITRYALITTIAVGITVPIMANIEEHEVVSGDILEKEVEDSYSLKINIECEEGAFTPSYLTVFRSDAKWEDEPVWSSSSEFEVVLPIDTYVVQVIGSDEGGNQYCLYVATDDGNIKIKREELIKVEISLDAGDHNEEIDYVHIAPVELYFPFTTGISLDNQKEDSSHVYILKNDRTSIEVGITKDGYTYGLRDDINTQTDSTFTIGTEFKKLQDSTHFGSFQAGNTGWKNFESVRIVDQYSNKLIYIGSTKSIGKLSIQGNGYDASEELIWNGGTKFNVPAKNGTYTLKLDFSDTLPIPVPDIEGTFSVTGGSDEETDETIDEVKVKQFISRLYETCLGRESDEGGLEYWAQLLKSGNVDGAGLASFFVNSDEFQNKGLSSEEYIRTMYTAFFGRQADEDGLTFWKSNLDQGLTKNYVLAGFVNSQEYQQICDTYGIVRGSVGLNSILDQNPNITKFIYRMYTKCMNRIPDEDGLNYWVQGLVDGAFTGKSTAAFFVNSSEFENKNFSNGEYVEVMYEVFFGRASDESGKAYWLQVLAKGDSRETVFNGFVSSQEYKDICSEYGIKFE